MAKRRYRTKKRNKQRSISHRTKKRRNNKRRTKRRTKSKRMKGGMDRIKDAPEDTEPIVGVSRDWVPPADDGEAEEAARLEAEAAEREWNPEIMEQQRDELVESISKLKQGIATDRNLRDDGGDLGTMKMKIGLKQQEIKDAESKLLILNEKIKEVQDDQSAGCSIM